MNTIWKYELQHECSIEMPVLSQILSVQVQDGQTCLWVLVNPQNINETRKFVVFGTGHKVPKSGLEFIDTIQLHGGQLVLHVFEKTD